MNAIFWVLLATLAATPDKVTNGKRAVGKPWTLTFEAELRISSNDVDDDHVWAGSNQVVQVDRKGHMFLMDQRDSRLLEWDASGAFVRAIGGRGEGPGEFQNMVNFQIFDDGRALVFENFGAVTRISLYDSSFAFVERKSLNLPFFPRFGTFNQDRSLMAATTTRVDPQRQVEITEYLIVACDLGEEAFTKKESLLYWETMSLDSTRINDPNHWAEFLGQRFRVLSKGQNAFAVFEGKDVMYSAQADAYEVTRWQAKGNELVKNRTIRRDYDPIPLTQAEVDALILPVREAILTQLPTNLQELISVNLIRRAAKLAEFPGVKFPIAGLSLMEDGTLIVIHEVNPQTRLNRGDLFDREGRYRGSFTIGDDALTTMVFRGRHAYAVETHEDGSNSLVRFRFDLKK
ncbi:6-bladed beta-propeller [Sulfidibacter corallicola]|uniref:6-bladed beta-propeller n=1 Tax=Sulfidibacter corallicola TaxID=2818388 RepID=A0A8A4TS01_SULCO|nr:6-bladed beta-propeller [Sulfidibacter corallicola]QTD52293.1 6-bladed beta-propeller [Sulfidibacter corallicola]